MLLCSRCASRVLRLGGLASPNPRRSLARDTSEEVPTSFNADLEENKTSVTIINEDKTMVFFERFGRYGFKLSTGIFVLGPVLAFPKSIFSWQVSTPSQISPASLSALRVIYPRPDIFLLGKGDPAVRLDSAPLVKWFREIGINWEILPTEEALTTFNFLNSEGRHVAGAFMPPSMQDMYQEELAALEAQKRRRPGFKLFESTGGNYSSELLDPPEDLTGRISAGEAASDFARSLTRSTVAASAELKRRQRLVEDFGGSQADADTARAAQAAKERVKAERHRLQEVDEARRRVEGEGDGNTGRKSD